MLIRKLSPSVTLTQSIPALETVRKIGQKLFTMAFVHNPESPLTASYTDEVIKTPPLFSP